LDGRDDHLSARHARTTRLLIERSRARGHVANTVREIHGPVDATTLERLIDA